MLTVVDKGFRLANVSFVSTKQPAGHPIQMTAKTIARLHKFFDGLDRDLEIGLATALADKLSTSPAVIFSEYEAWQIA